MILIRKAILIYNPLAGPADWDEPVKKLVAFWRRHGWDLAVAQTARAGHATELARAAAGEGRELVLAGGGDGTLGEIASGLADTETIMAPLPMGTGNSFAKELGMTSRLGFFSSDKLLQMSEALLAGRVHRIDLGYSRPGRCWLLWASVGVDSFVVDKMEPRSKLLKRLGPLGYVGESLPAIPQFPGMKATVTVDGRTFRGDFLMITVSNCRLYAGGELRLSPAAQLDDGLFEVWLFRGKETLVIFQYLMEVALGRHQDDPNVEMVTGREVSVHTEPPLPYHKDGDPAGTTPFACTLKPGALRLLAPNTAPPDLFGRPGEPLEAG
jgi:diacylglycerol kinase (ATP)